MSRIIAVSIVSLIGALPLAAQGRATRERPAQACDMSQRIVGVQLVDRNSGAPIEGATVSATRVRSKQVIQQAATMGTPGLYYIAQDGELKDLTRAGEPLRIVATLGSRRVTANYTLGLDARGCHVDLRGPKEIKL
jgi:hypothetical protein